MRVPKITTHYKSIEEFEEVAKQYFLLRPKLSEYRPPEMRSVLRITPDQLGIITMAYNRTKGDFEKCMEGVRLRNEGKRFVDKKQIESNRYAKYSDYLKTDYWKNHRILTFKKSKRCVLCNCKASLAHHRSYRHRGTDREIKHLISLCKSCHQLFHDNHEYNNTTHVFLRK